MESSPPNYPHVTPAKAGVQSIEKELDSRFRGNDGAVLVYQTMREKGLKKADLARLLAWHAPQVDRLLDLHHATRLDQIDAAMAVMEKRIEVKAG